MQMSGTRTRSSLSILSRAFSVKLLHLESNDQLDAIDRPVNAIDERPVWFPSSPRALERLLRLRERLLPRALCGALALFIVEPGPGKTAVIPLLACCPPVTFCVDGLLYCVNSSLTTRCFHCSERCVGAQVVRACLLMAANDSFY
jgi:hypothetical protein